ncbi:MAG: C-terminal domain of RACo the domain [Archaeoglobaceae archaeon]|nr:C-terminal domain of RACo the domain [Archaeoglobaceae archaeon]
MALLSLDVRDEMEKVVQKVEYVELSVEKDFHSVFIRAIPI